MVQRQARVGDTLEDYCPHDSETTSHIVVETNDDVVTITRCQQCDAEHDYPGKAAEPEVSDRRDGPVRRPLIRASLPHPDGSQPPPREPPVFTMHEQPPRGNTWGKGGRGGGSGANGNRARNGNNQPKKHGRRRGGQGRPGNEQAPSGNNAGNRANGNQARPEGRSGSKSRSSRRGRGRSR